MRSFPSAGVTQNIVAAAHRVQAPERSNKPALSMVSTAAHDPKGGSENHMAMYTVGAASVTARWPPTPTWTNVMCTYSLMTGENSRLRVN